MDIQSIDIVVKPDYDPDTSEWEADHVDEWQRGVRDAYSVRIDVAFGGGESRSYLTGTSPLENVEAETVSYVEALKSEAREDLERDGILDPGGALEWPEPRYLGRD